MASPEHQAKEAGHCIFCGSLGLTKEHLFADWLRAYIPRDMQHHTIRTAIIQPEAADQVELQRRNGDMHNRRVRCVCASCNNGWMSRLQSSAKPFLIPCLTGQPTVLHRRARRTIAAWAAMMVMVGEYTDREFAAIPSTDHSFLREQQEPPLHWRIWIGAHNRQEYPLYNHHVLSLIPKEEIEGFSDDFLPKPNTQTTTICVGNYLVIHVMSSVIAKAYIRRWVMPPQIRAGLHQIWPIGLGGGGDARWSPYDNALTDRGLALLADHFFERGERLAAAQLRGAHRAPASRRPITGTLSVAYPTSKG